MKMLQLTGSEYLFTQARRKAYWSLLSSIKQL